MPIGLRNVQTGQVGTETIKTARDARGFYAIVSAGIFATFPDI